MIDNNNNSLYELVYMYLKDEVKNNTSPAFIVSSAEAAEIKKLITEHVNTKSELSNIDIEKLFIVQAEQITSLENSLYMYCLNGFNHIYISNISKFNSDFETTSVEQIIKNIISEASISITYISKGLRIIVAGDKKEGLENG